MNHPSGIRPATAAIIVTILIIVVWALAYPIAKVLPPNALADPLSSSYNILNVLFTALAFGGVVVTLIFQSHEARIARSESVERSILEMFQILTSSDFQATKNSAYRALIAVIENKEYGEFVASKLFAVDQLPFPGNERILGLLKRLDSHKAEADTQTFESLERHDRLKLDDMMNFFSMIAQRASSKSIVNHVDFAYDWWRPALLLLAQLQKERWESNESIRKYCKNRLLIEIVRSLDVVYGHDPIESDSEVIGYLKAHPLLVDRFKLDPDYWPKRRASA